MKLKQFLFVLLSTISFLGFSQLDTSYLDSLGSDNLFDERYGDLERNTFDILLPKSETPTPLVLFIHGGGFYEGDKETAYWRKEDLEHFIDNGIAYMTINYSYKRENDSVGVRRSLDDMKKAIQYIRHNADKYNIDRERLAIYGYSAGAGSALYFAYHDDMKIEGDTTLLGESTKPTCVGAIECQATYDVFKWKTFVSYVRLGSIVKRKALYDYASQFYGYPDYKSFKDIRKTITSDLDMLTMIDEQDPPTYLMTFTHKIKGQPIDILHHASHPKEVAKKLKKNKVSYYSYTYSKKIETEADIHYNIRQFLSDQLLNSLATD